MIKPRWTQPAALLLILMLAACSTEGGFSGFSFFGSTDKPQPANTTASNAFLADLSAAEVTSMRDEAWHLYGPDWKNMAKRSRYVRQPLLETLDRYGYPEELQMVPVVESSYNPYAYSGVGAAGLWQLMPATASDMGLKSSTAFDARRDIRSSTRAAAKFLMRQHKRFNSWPLALAAYHLGPNAVQRRLDRHPWQAGDALKKLPLPPITKAYIRHILGLIALHDAGRISFPAPYPTVVLTLQTPVDLASLQRTSGLPQNQIFRFNPELELRQYYDGKQAALSLRISSVRAKALKRQLPKKSANLTITIAHGETVRQISRRYHVSVYQLRQVNPHFSNTLKTGQKLHIPAKAIGRIVAERNPLVQAQAKLLASNG